MRIVHSAYVLFLLLGEPFVLECKAESLFDSEIRYSWTKNGRPFIINGVDVFNESSSNGNILFISPKSSDEGTYQCEAINNFAKAFSQASLLRIQQRRPKKISVEQNRYLCHQLFVYIILLI